HLLNRRRDLHIDRVLEAPALSVVDERAAVDEGADELLQEEGVPLRGLDDASLHLRRERSLSDERVEELPAGVAGERLQRELARAMGKLALGVLLDAPGRVVALRPSRQHEQQGRGFGLGEATLQQLE